MEVARNPFRDLSRTSTYSNPGGSLNRRGCFGLLPVGRGPIIRSEVASLAVIADGIDHVLPLFSGSGPIGSGRITRCRGGNPVSARSGNPSDDPSGSGRVPSDLLNCWRSIRTVGSPITATGAWRWVPPSGSSSRSAFAKACLAMSSWCGSSNPKTPTSSTGTSSATFEILIRQDDLRALHRSQAPFLQNPNQRDRRGAGSPRQGGSDHCLDESCRGGRQSRSRPVAVPGHPRYGPHPQLLDPGAAVGRVGWSRPSAADQAR